MCSWFRPHAADFFSSLLERHIRFGLCDQWLSVRLPDCRGIVRLRPEKPILKELCMKRAGVESQRGYRVGIALIRSTMLSMQALGIAGGPWLDLAIRFWLAKGFLIGATPPHWRCKRR